MKKPSNEFVFEFLAKRNPLPVDQSQYVCMLMDFEELKGIDAMYGLAGFYLFAIKHYKGEEKSRAIESTFAHDLGGRKDKFMEPRSSSPGFKEVFLNEYYPEMLTESQRKDVEILFHDL